MFFLWMVFDPGLVFLEGVQSLVSVLFMDGVQSLVSVLFMDGVQSWSRHQKCKRIGLGTQGISWLLFIRFTPEFLSLVPQELSWSRHQKCKRIGLVQKVK